MPRANVNQENSAKNHQRKSQSQISKSEFHKQNLSRSKHQISKKFKQHQGKESRISTLKKEGKRFSLRELSKSFQNSQNS